MVEQILNTLQSLILEKGLLLIVLCMVVGQLIKRTNKIDNNWINIGVAIFGAVIAVISSLLGSELFKEPDILLAAVEGAILGFASSGLYDLLAKSEWFREKFGSKTEEVINE